MPLIIVVFVFLLFFSFLIGIGIRRLHVKKREQYNRPVICICRVNGYIGVVVRSDLEAASSAFWKPFRDGTKRYDHEHLLAPLGVRIQVPRTFLFKGFSPEYYTLVRRCYVEQSVFDVDGQLVDDIDSFREAYLYVYGRTWTDKEFVQSWV